MRIFFPIAMAIATSAILFNCQVHAKPCARCTKIEVERAEEQAEHPQLAGYYDDAIHLHTSDDRKQASPAKEETDSSVASEISEKSDSSSANKKSTSSSAFLTTMKLFM